MTKTAHKAFSDSENLDKKERKRSYGTGYWFTFGQIYDRRRFAKNSQ